MLDVTGTEPTKAKFGIKNKRDGMKEENLEKKSSTVRYGTGYSTYKQLYR